MARLLLVVCAARGLLQDDAEGHAVLEEARRVAEELVYGSEEVTTGASNDLQQVRNIARRMVAQWGFTATDERPSGGTLRAVALWRYLRRIISAAEFRDAIMGCAACNGLRKDEILVLTII